MKNHPENKLADIQVLVVGRGVWGRGPTLRDALVAAQRPKKYIVYLCHSDTNVDFLGRLDYPIAYPPREIHRVGIKRDNPSIDAEGDKVGT
jgi:hypothetical protein